MITSTVEAHSQCLVHFCRHVIHVLLITYKDQHYLPYILLHWNQILPFYTANPGRWLQILMSLTEGMGQSTT